MTNTNEPKIKDLGEEMIEYCGGLPLAITVLGGLLATKKALNEWEDVLKHIKSYIFKDDLRVNKVLSLSYNDLPFHLKLCFLYLGHFLEDFEIPTKELIQMWMGRRFYAKTLHEDSEYTMEYGENNICGSYCRGAWFKWGKLANLEGSKLAESMILCKTIAFQKPNKKIFSKSPTKIFTPWKEAKGVLVKFEDLLSFWNQMIITSMNILILGPFSTLCLLKNFISRNPSCLES